MIHMRSLSILVLSLLVVLPLTAQQQPLHQATPVDQLLKQFWAAHPEMSHDHMHHQLVAEMEPVQKQTDAVTVNATKSFTIVASSFTFTVTPSPFVVNQGDSVTLDVSTKSNDSAIAHGFLLEQYFPNGVTLNRGQHRTITFVANVPGTFTYVCTVPSCGTGHNNMVGELTVSAPASPPTITSFTPTQGSANGGNNVAITGTNFQNGATVKFGDTAAVSVTVNSSTSINATSPVHAAGAVDITVTNPDGQTATSPNPFTYLTAAPSITSVTPSSGSNAGGTPITIAGSNFVTGATVTIGGAPATVTNVTTGSITATTPPGPFDLATTASRDVKVTNPDSRSFTLSNGFTYTLPAPAITGLSPNGSVPGGGTSVTIVGSGFSSGVAMSVTFGGVAGTNVVVTSPTSLSVTAPAHAVGVVDVVVHAGSASATAAGSFTYQQPSKKRRAVKLS